MKLLFVISSLTSGGAERVLTRLANHWSEKGWDVTILAIIPLDIGFYKLDENIKVVSLGMRYESTLANNAWYIYGIRKIIKEGDFDAVISFISAINILTLFASRGLKTPIIISERNNVHALKSSFWRKLRHWTYHWTDALVVLSTYDYNHYSFVKNKKIIFNPLSNLLTPSIEAKEKIILAVGSLTQQKGYERLFQALSNIELKDWKVIVIGIGGKQKELEDQLKRLKLESHVNLIGRREDVNEFYKRASIFVLSSHWEGFPNVLAEAMGSGCACVSFDCLTGPSNIINDGENGFLVEQNNVNLFGQKIALLIENPSLREQFYTEGITINKRLDINKIATQWEECIDSLRRK